MSRLSQIQTLVNTSWRHVAPLWLSSD
ncbi:uncharacterized protein METZ01_LOCUS271524, partial [marine metagenome]